MHFNCMSYMATLRHKKPLLLSRKFKILEGIINFVQLSVLYSERKRWSSLFKTKYFTGNTKQIQRISTSDDIPENQNRRTICCIEAEKTSLQNRLKHRPVAEGSDIKIPNVTDDQAYSIEVGKDPIKGKIYPDQTLYK